MLRPSLPDLGWGGTSFSPESWGVGQKLQGGPSTIGSPGQGFCIDLPSSCGSLRSENPFFWGLAGLTSPTAVLCEDHQAYSGFPGAGD